MRTETVRINETARLEAYIQSTETAYGQYEDSPCVIICPGGGFLLHTPSECDPIAMEFLSRGYQCFVLYYTVGADKGHPERGLCNQAACPQQTLELLTAIHIVRARSREWHADREKLFLLGASAGGHVAAGAGTRWDDPELTEQLDFVPEEGELKASGMILCYPMLGNHTLAYTEWQEEVNPGMPEKLKELTWRVVYGGDDPSEEERRAVDLKNFISGKTVPAFIWHSIDDPLIDPSNSTGFIQRLQECRVPCEYHLFGHGGHGLALAKDDPSVRLWTEMACLWMKRQGRSHVNT